MGVKLMNLENEDSLVGIARAVDETEIEEESNE
jgi:hypothetical protein